MSASRLSPISFLFLLSLSSTAAVTNRPGPPTGPTTGLNRPTSRHPAALAPPQGTQRTDPPARRLLEWAAARGVRTAAGFTLARFGTLDGVCADAPLRAGSTIVALPRAQTLAVKAAGDHPPAGASRAAWEEGTWFARLAMLLLLEEARGAARELGPYVELLPAQFDTPMHWAEGELKELQSDAFVRRVAEDRARVEEAYAWAAAIAPDLGLAPPLRLEHFVWAVECVRSRAFSTVISGDVRVLAGSVLSGAVGLAMLCIDGAVNHLPGGELLPTCAVAASGLAAVWQLWYDATSRGLTYVMCPVIDSMNHKSGGVGRPQVPELVYSSLKDAYLVISQRDVPAGEQIYISYGSSKDNDALLMYYGFVERENPAQRVTVQLGSGDAGGESLQLTRSGHLAKHHLSAQECADICRRELDALPTTIEFDEQLQEVGVLSCRHQMAIEWRLERKRMLLEFSDAIAKVAAVA